MIDDDDLLALCVWSEARGEPNDGKAAVAQVIKNRMAAKYESDGTMQGTALKYDQFSWAYFAFANGKYSRVCWTPADALAMANKLLPQAQHQVGSWQSCSEISAAIMAGTYQPEDAETFNKLIPHALLYDNLSISQPPWAIPAKMLCKIGSHSFFSA
jgi:spore germination cell wall hydrolase CwlJ-like protein